MEFVILGPTALHVDGHSVPLGAAKQRGMMAILLYEVGNPVRVDTIVEHLWSTNPTVDRRANLYALASRIRSVLASVGLGDALTRIPGIGAYQLNIDPEAVDFHRFRRLVTLAREAIDRQRHDIAGELLAGAVDLWHSEPLADLRGIASEQLRRALQDDLLDAQKLLVGCLLRLGRHHTALTRLEPLIRTHNSDEVLAQHWLTALRAAGRDDEAQTFVAGFRRRFRREMGTEPTLSLPAKSVNVLTGPRQLPNDINDFAGHDELMTALDALTAATTVAAISGMPGVGKTTFVVHWAHRNRDRFPDGQLFLNANGYGPPPIEPYDALGRFLHALGVPADRVPVSSDQRRDLYNQILADRQVLIVLDNARDSAQIRPLVPTSTGCVMLLTSRNRLRGLMVRDGVPDLTVPPLTQKECLGLLTKVIGAARATDEPDAVRALARLSGGLPLAVRIIGEHVAARPRAAISDLVDELTERLLDADSEDDQDSDLRSVFGWSYNALAPDVARLYRFLGLHPGTSISRESAGALAGIPPHDAERMLNVLAKAHLVNHDVAHRYRLHDLLRRYAEDQALREESASCRADAIRRLLDWFVLSSTNAATALAPNRSPVPDLPAPGDVQPLTFSSDDDAMRWCDAERVDFTAIIRTAIDHGHYRHGWQIPDVLHDAVERHGRLDHVLELLELALVAAGRDGHQEAQIGTLSNIGSVYFSLRDYDRAGSYFARGLRLAQDIGFPEGETACGHNLASVYLKSGDVPTAIDLYQGLLARFRETDDPTGEASTSHRLGEAYRQVGRFDEAQESYLRALAIREQIGSLRGQGDTHRELADLFLLTGDHLAALRHCRRALDIHGHTRDEAARCDALITMADVKRALGRHREAVQDGSAAADLACEIGDAQRRCQALTVLAEALAAIGDRTAAERVCDQAFALVDQLDPGMSGVRQRLVRVHGNPGAADGGGRSDFDE